MSDRITRALLAQVALQCDAAELDRKPARRRADVELKARISIAEAEYERAMVRRALEHRAQIMPPSTEPARAVETPAPAARQGEPEKEKRIVH